MGVSKNRGTPKWMVYNGKPYWNGWFGGTIIFGNIHIVLTNMACWLNHHLIWYYSLKPIFTPCFLSAKRDFFKHTVYATTFVTNMAAKRWKIAANPHYQTPAFCLLQVSPSSNSVKFSVLLQCLDIFTQLAADRILNKKKQIPMKLPIFPNRAANGWTLGCCFLLLDVL